MGFTHMHTMDCDEIRHTHAHTQADKQAQRRHRMAVNEIMESGGNFGMFLCVHYQQHHP